jgi:hypothetical protein
VSVFVSYSNRDSSVARALIQDIELTGRGVWFDEVLIGGDDGLRRADTQVIEYDTASSTSGIRLVVALLRVGDRNTALPSPLPEPPRLPFSDLHDIAHMINNPELRGKDQVAIIGQLRTKLRSEQDESARQQICELLESLYGHPECTKSNAKELEALLASSISDGLSSRKTDQPHHRDATVRLLQRRLERVHLLGLHTHEMRPGRLQAAPTTIPSSRFVELPPQPVEYTLRFGLAAVVEAGVGSAHRRWRHPRAAEAPPRRRARRGRRSAHVDRAVAEVAGPDGETVWRVTTAARSTPWQSGTCPGCRTT